MNCYNNANACANRDEQVGLHNYIFELYKYQIMHQRYTLHYGYYMIYDSSYLNIYDGIKTPQITYKYTFTLTNNTRLNMNTHTTLAVDKEHTWDNQIELKVKC